MSAYRIMVDAVTHVITQQDHTIVAVGVDISLVLTKKAVMVRKCNLSGIDLRTVYICSIQVPNLC